MFKKLKITFSMFMALFVSAAFVLKSAPALSEVSFKGNTINLIVPFREGGGTTLYARFLVPLFEKHLPGNPKVLIRNMPGGAAARGTNYFYRNAKNDGLMILTGTSSSLIQFALGAKAVKYDFADFVPVLTSPLGIVIYSSAKFGIKKGEASKLIGENLVFGSRKPNGSELPVLIGFNLLGYKYKFVGGLSAGKRRQAFSRGETNINYDSANSYVKKVIRMVDQGKAVPLYTYGLVNNSGQIMPDPMVKDLPTYFDVYEKVHGKKISGIEGRTLEALFNARVMASKMIILHKKTKPSILQAYHDAAKKVVNDPMFKSKQGQKIVGPYNQLLGQEALRAMQKASKLGSAEEKWLKKWLKDNFDI